MKVNNSLKIVFLVLLLVSVKNSSAQWSYIQAIDSSLTKNISKYETWLSHNGFEITRSQDQAALIKAQSLSAIYNLQLKAYSFQAQRQPINIRAFTNEKNILKAIDIFLVRPQQGEYENLQLVILKSKYKLLSETKNRVEKATITLFIKKNQRLSVTYADDKTFIIISATTLGTHE